MIRYKKLGYIALNVTDVERSRAWYQSMVGLTPNGYGPSGEAFMRADHDHHSLVLHQGATPGLKRIGWQLEDDRQLDVVARVLDQHGLRWRSLDADECAAIGMTHTIRFAEPITGLTLDFYGSGMTQRAEPATSPVCELDFLCHIGIGTPRYREAIRFYEEVLNFKTSDEIDGRINLMRAFPNPMHHSRDHRVFPARPESFDTKGAVPERRMAAAGDIEVVKEI